MNNKMSSLELLRRLFPELTESTSAQLFAYLNFVLDTNKKTNLTAITDYHEAVIKHLIDSLIISRWSLWPQQRMILDLGSGGGFPGIPLAIAFPAQNFYLLEANKKKAEFLTAVKDYFALDNVYVLHDRAETLAHETNHREQYDLVIARAVAEISILLELTLPFCKAEHYFLAYKGKNYELELEQAQKAQTIFGAELRKVIPYELPEGMGSRNLLVFQKTKPTPEKYPRRPGIPAKRPL